MFGEVAEPKKRLTMKTTKIMKKKKINFMSLMSFMLFVVQI